jgi:periplasmic protein TonB
VQEPFEFLEAQPRNDGTAAAVIISVALHLVAFSYILVYHAIPPKAPELRSRFVELISPSQSRRFTEAPGRALMQKPANPAAAFSDANRRASMPHPTGPNPTTRPGEAGTYAPGQAASRGRSSQRIAQEASAASGVDLPLPDRSAQQQSRSSIDWRAAIQQAGERAGTASGLGTSGAPGSPGGEVGTADAGTVSFETQWYDWGEYAQGMVARIRVNWYGIMPELIKLGVKGIVTLRFTLHRDGTITDISMLRSSGVPPYDFAARKALELSSPLARLPKDFPNDSEHVTVMFYYNTPIK